VKKRYILVGTVLQLDNNCQCSLVDKLCYEEFENVLKQLAGISVQQFPVIAQHMCQNNTCDELMLADQFIQFQTESLTSVVLFLAL